MSVVVMGTERIWVVEEPNKEKNYLIVNLHGQPDEIRAVVLLCDKKHIPWYKILLKEADGNVGRLKRLFEYLHGEGVRVSLVTRGGQDWKTIHWIIGDFVSPFIPNQQFTIVNVEDMVDATIVQRQFDTNLTHLESGFTNPTIVLSGLLAMGMLNGVLHEVDITK